MLLRSLTFPTAILSLALQPGEQCIYAGANDGCIFEASLVRDSPAGPGPSANAVGDGRHHDDSFHTLRGHDQSVNALAFSSDARLLVSGDPLLCVPLTSFLALGLHVLPCGIANVTGTACPR